MEIFNISTTRPADASKFKSDQVCIDYIFIDDSLEAQKLNVDVTDISDHYPIIADINFK